MSGERWTPTISVILPTLNAARTLDRCLAALRAQDYPADRVEIVLADAGSTDGTLDIAKRYAVERIVPNERKTGEAGKAAAIAASTGEVLALVDSDNIFDDTAYFRKMTAALARPGISFAEPLYWTFDPEDTLVNRYSALLGMNDPLSYFLGNYNRYSHLSGTFTGMPVRVREESGEAVVIEVSPAHVPTFGANGFFIRRSVLDDVTWQPYYFDIDVFQQAVAKGHTAIALVKTGTRHLFCDSIATFRRKQARRVRDYFFHSRGDRRSYNYGSVPGRRYLSFVLATVTVVPLLLQSLRGYVRKPDPAWWFHLPACWITLWEYGWGTVLSRFTTAEFDRSTWRQ